MPAHPSIRRFTVLAAALAASCGPLVSEGQFESAAQELVVCAGPNVVEGIDVSYYQGTIDWHAVAASGKKFAIARIGDGLTFSDPQWDRNWAGIKNAGMIRGAYQFFRPGQDPVAQANLVVAKVGKLGPRELPVMLDLESSDGQSPATIMARARTWANIVTAGTGREPYIYTYKSFWDVNCGGSHEFKDFHFGIAAYGPVCPNIPSPWTGWTFFQYSSTGRVPGIVGNVDLDKFNGTLEQLETYASGGITDDNCTAQEKANCGGFGCGCVDHVCNGGFCAGKGCSAQHAANCAAFGCNCADGMCSGGYCPGTGCSAKETLDCGKVGATCVDHVCAGGASSPGSGCTAKELNDCGKFGCGCSDHKCGGGYCPGDGCSASETSACAAKGKTCNANKCVDSAPKDGGTVTPPKDGGTAPQDAGVVDAGVKFDAGTIIDAGRAADGGVRPLAGIVLPALPSVSGGCQSAPAGLGWLGLLGAGLAFARRSRREN